MGYWARVIAVPFVGTVGGTLIVAGFTFEAARRGATTYELGLMTAAFQFMRALGAPLGGALSDRAGSRKPFVMAGSLGLIVAIGIALMASGVFGLILARGVQGVAAGFLWSGMQTVVTETATRPATAMSTYFAMGELGRSAGFAVYSLWLADRSIATLVVAMMVLTSTLFLVMYAVPARIARPRSRGSWFAGHGRHISFIFFASAFSGGIVALSNEVMLGYLGLIRGLGESGATITLLWANLAAQGVMFAVARVAERRSYAVASLLAFALMTAGATAMPIVPAHFLTLPLTVLLGGAYSFTPLSRLLAGKIEPERLGTGIGFVNMSSNAGGVVFPPLMGQLIVLHSTGAVRMEPWFLLAALSLVAGVMLAFVILPRLPVVRGDSG
ncbi:MAG: MFS transporter [bacterium JZ-2024 1]